jgi:signal transduction histidine kinase
MTAAALERNNGKRMMQESLPSRGGSFVAALLRVPLIAKIIGANTLLLIIGLLLHEVYPLGSVVTEFVVLLLLNLVVSGMLAWLALRPVAELEMTAERVSSGDFTARVQQSSLADRDILKLATTMNRLLERVEADRARIQYLAGRSVRARDIELESVARELRDSLAQMVSAVGMQLAAARRVATNPAVIEQLEATSATIQQLTEEMKSVADTLYPGTLGEFGLQNALDVLVRRMARRSKVKIELEAGMFDARLSSQAASALYRVADEALRNIVQHGDARNARILLHSNGHVVLEIEDDGRGMDMRSQDPLQAGLGLFSAKAVLALAGGELQISSAPGLGTRVVARVPITEVPEQ